MNKFVEVTIKDVVVGLYDGPHATPPPSDSGPIFLGIQNIKKHGGLDLTEIRHINESDWPKWTKRITPHEGDIVFTYEATLNLYAIIPKGFRGCLGRRMALLRIDHRKINHKYLYYYFFSPQWRRVIDENILSGATVDRIPLTNFPDFKILVPQRKTQDLVAAFLRTFDELIEANEKRIRDLDEMSKGIYREWFVNFKFPGYENAKLVDSGHPDFGMIPEDWDITLLENLCELYRDSVQPQKKGDNLFQHYSLPSYDNSKRPILENGSGIKSSKYSLKSKTILFPKLNPRIPRVWRLESVENNSICSSEFLPLYAGKRLEFVYALLSSPIFLANCITEAAGTSNSHQRLNPDNFMKKSVLLPPPDLVDRYCELAEPMNRLIDALNQSNHSLQLMRDLLLPKLISGAIDLSELNLEEILENVGQPAARRIAEGDCL